MSAASRARKTKKSKRRVPGRPGGARGGGRPSGPPTRVDAGAEALAGSRERPAWFDPAINRVLDRSASVMAARGPRELEQATATLLGAELQRIIGDEDHGLWFDWWFGEVAEAAAARVQGAARDAWQAPWRLLHGMMSIGSPALTSIVRTAISHASVRAHTAQQKDPKRQQPAWLWKLPMIRATGEIWHMRDVYGSRLAIIAGFCYPSGADQAVFLFDIDACGPVILAGGGVYDDVTQAATAWRAVLDDAASDAQPATVESVDDLRCLAELDTEGEAVAGPQTRAVADNWFRARRRIHDLADALVEQGMPLPDTQSRHDVDPAPMAEAFTRWRLESNGAEPDPDAVAALAAQWLEGTLPGTEHAASPHRVAVQLSTIGHRTEDDPVTVAAKALLPEWVRWHGQQAGLPEAAIARSVAVATGELPGAPDYWAARL